MPSLHVYDTKGNERSSSGTTGQTDDRVKDLFYEGVRFAIETGRETKYTLFFRARETQNARTEQFYAVQKTRSGSIQEFITALHNRIESEWGYTIDDSADDMSVFRTLERGATSRPGTDREQAILKELVESREGARVSVRNAENALGTIKTLTETYTRAAIADSPGSNALSGFDLVVVPNGSKGITPVGDTEERWESTKASLRSQHIDQEIASINESVQTLAHDYGLSSSEIRSRVSKRVPALNAPRSGGSDRSQVDNLTASGSSDRFNLAAIGKYVAIASVIGIVLILGTVGATTLGVPGMLGLGGEEVDGTVYVDAAGEEAASNVTVTLESDGSVYSESETTNDGAFSFEDVSEGEYHLSVDSAEGVHYDERPVDVPGNATDLEIHPTEATVSGEVVDAETGDALSADSNAGVNATVELINENGERVDNATGGSYEFTVVDLDTGYKLRVDADGYDSVERPVNSFGTQDPIELGSASATLFGQVTDSEGDPIGGATVNMISGSTSAPKATTDDNGEYKITGIPPGEEYSYKIEADGYETKRVSIDFSDGDVERNFTLNKSS